jgi:hypothetical protein
MKTNINVEFDEKYYDILKEMANGDSRSIKATIELITVQYIDSRIALNTISNILSNL